MREFREALSAPTFPKAGNLIRIMDSFTKDRLPARLRETFSRGCRFEVPPLGDGVLANRMTSKNFNPLERAIAPPAKAGTPNSRSPALVPPAAIMRIGSPGRIPKSAADCNASGSRSVRVIIVPIPRRVV